VQAPLTQLNPAGHAAQVAPAAPHDCAVGVMHAPVAGSQQPAQLAGPHEQVPVAVLQVMPGEQSALLAQPQRPPTQSLPTIEETQSTHEAPPPPQLTASPPPAQRPLLQQPAQVPWPVSPHASVQTPAWQVGVSPPHAAHAAPATPHEALLCSSTMTQLEKLSQQPAQLSGVHTHWPATQACPTGHSGLQVACGEVSQPAAPSATTAKRRHQGINRRCDMGAPSCLAASYAHSDEGRNARRVTPR
jgi:hypothetical protein